MQPAQRTLSTAVLRSEYDLCARDLKPRLKRDLLQFRRVDPDLLELIVDLERGPYVDKVDGLLARHIGCRCRDFGGSHLGHADVEVRAGSTWVGVAVSALSHAPSPGCEGRLDLRVGQGGLVRVRPDLRHKLCPADLCCAGELRVGLPYATAGRYVLSVDLAGTRPYEELLARLRQIAEPVGWPSGTGRLVDGGRHVEPNS